LGNPIAGVDRGVAVWFHAHLTSAFVSVLRTVTEFGSSEWIAVVLSIAVLVGLIRIALGAHYLTDVVARVFFGMTWLTLCRFVVRPWRRIALPPVIANLLPEAEPALVPVPVVTEAESSAAATANSLI